MIPTAAGLSALGVPWSLPILNCTHDLCIRTVAFDALFEAVHYAAKAPAMEIDVLIYAVAVERLLLHKRPRRIHIRHVEEEHAAYRLLAVVAHQRSTRHHHVGMFGEVRLVGRTVLLARPRHLAGPDHET